MKRIGIGLGLGLCLAVGTCSLQETIQLVKIGGGLYCQYEPSTSKIIGLIDTSSGTAKNLDKIDNVTARACALAAQKLGAGI